MIWILGGTVETAQFLNVLDARTPYIITVATAAGKEMLPVDVPVQVGRMTRKAMRRFIQKHAIDVVVDLSHPYAIEVSRNARCVCDEAEIPYLRYVRQTSETAGAITVATLKECLQILQNVQGCVFCTTGSTFIPEFQRIRGNNRFVYRVLPTPESLDICQQHQVALRDIVTMLGPFSEALNIVMFSEYKADYVVMKDSGAAGGTPEKLSACRHLGITPVIIGRPDEHGFSQLQELAESIHLSHDKDFS